MLYSAPLKTDITLPLSIDRFAIPVWKIYIGTAYSEIFMVAAHHGMALGAIWNIWNLPGAPVNFYYSICSKAEVF